MAFSFRNTIPGDTVNVLYRGSKALGNEAYRQTQVVESVGVNTVTFEDDTIVSYRDGRWRYGTSDEVASVVSIVRNERTLVNI